jgi:hypothetical protein
MNHDKVLVALDGPITVPATMAELNMVTEQFQRSRLKVLMVPFLE